MGAAALEMDTSDGSGQTLLARHRRSQALAEQLTEFWRTA
jgi:hypothetical protein